MQPATRKISGCFMMRFLSVFALAETHLGKFRANGAERITGEAQFTEPKTVQVALNTGGTRMLRGDRVFLAVGTRASLPDVPGLADARPLTHVEALDLEWSMMIATITAAQSPKTASKRDCTTLSKVRFWPGDHSTSKLNTSAIFGDSYQSEWSRRVPNSTRLSPPVLPMTAA